MTSPSEKKNGNGAAGHDEGDEVGQSEAAAENLTTAAQLEEEKATANKESLMVEEAKGQSNDQVEPEIIGQESQVEEVK